MKKELVLDGLHQYSMHVYKSLVDSGFSEVQAKAEVTKLLLREVKYFDSKIIDTNLTDLMKRVLGRELTEEERYRLSLE